MGSRSFRLRVVSPTVSSPPPTSRVDSHTSNMPVRLRLILCASASNQKAFKMKYTKDCDLCVYL